MIKKVIADDLKKAVQSLGFPAGDIVLSIPKNSTFGDYITNVALQLAKQNPLNIKQTGVEVANEILQKFGKPEYLEKAIVAGNGFINFFVDPKILTLDLKEILEKGENYGKSEVGKGKTARVEFVSANPTGPLHIGNARGGPIGDVIANVLGARGYEVLREYIHNDVGQQVKALGATVIAKAHDDLASGNQYQGEYIKELVDRLSDDIEGKSDDKIGQMAVDILYEEIVQDCHSMGIKFDLVVKESELRKQAPEIIQQLQRAGVVKSKDGALWLAPNDEFLKDRETVIQKSDGGYTYFTSDIVYHKQKFESGAEIVIDVFGSNHHGHVPRLQAAISALGFDQKKLKVVLYQYVRVKRGDQIVKMSKRAGDFVTAREVLDEVGVDAFRFYLLKFGPQTHMDFDLDLLKEQSSRNPVFYVQYAHARMFNLLAKSENKDGEINFGLLTHPKEHELISRILYYPNLVQDLASNLQVHQLTEYAVELADSFHKFYESCPVISAENKELVDARLALVKAAKITLVNTLRLLGVSAPEKM